MPILLLLEARNLKGHELNSCWICSR